MVTLFNKTENGQFKCVEIVRDHNNNQVENMFLISILALLMVIALAETQKPPVLAQVNLFSKRLPARNLQSQQSSNSNFNCLTSTSVTFADWNTWKRQFNKSYSPSREVRAKKNYIGSIMFQIDIRFIDGGFSYSSGPTKNDANDFPPTVIWPRNFDKEFVQQYNKKYSSKNSRAYRKKVFEQNVAISPIITPWSDWTADEFNSILPAQLITYQMENKAIMRILRKNDNKILRSQTPPQLGKTGIVKQPEECDQQPMQRFRQQFRQIIQKAKKQQNSFKQRKQTARIPAQTLQFKGRI